MKIDEVKLRIKTFLDNTVDIFFSSDNVMSKISKATAKVYINQNIYKLNNILCEFGDENGEIDTNNIINIFENELFDNDGYFKLNVREILPESYSSIKEWIPNKLILFKKEDLEKIFK